ncbi:MAG TPA: transglutaminase-like cysteine peptidase [Gammaproteobacteria bacterium]|nr:transglutaminase-like cysteine peptidase [Gammaproteobacteria bacterium]
MFCFIVFFFPLLTIAKIEFDQDFIKEIEKKYGEYAARRLISWEKLIRDNQSLSEKEKLEKVNNFFNLLEYRSDKSNWGVEDYWATPLEFLVSGGGDCEDYSIAKYFTLIELGVEEKKLLITYAVALTLQQAHMVVTYYADPKSVPLVLDNLNGEILPGTERKDLDPIYSFNGAGLWRAKQLGLGKQLGKGEDLKRWVDLEKRMKKGEISKFYGSS